MAMKLASLEGSSIVLATPTHRASAQGPDVANSAQLHSGAGARQLGDLGERTQGAPKRPVHLRP
eukprot:CAMPEP_0177559900 /NCGR_PEP_ID=MMETSP0369-20130122/71092_1 /TAXON_ID=447022 ORGANISM="Scrippsiella hangoei-like, Strain SHHI-4" /NCGR_SAMPLE_ID=MMETSP0369 /ASSEMBLY_ACC=CAM_ASM_000364 /LENGTH=63 /DNA_ID=CAMNT_0019046679 /DNA_START=109 /DNA_END=301 /DNA_ORIENTATION=+